MDFNFKTWVSDFLRIVIERRDDFHRLYCWISKNVSHIDKYFGMFRCFGRLFSLTYFVLPTKLTFVTHCMEKQNWKDFSDRATRCWVPEMQQTKIKTIQGNAFDTARRSRETISVVFSTLDKRLLTKNMSLPRASRVSWLNAMDSQLGCNLFQGFTL